MQYWKNIKRLGRYLKGEPRIVQSFKFQRTPDTIIGWTDTDYAGCRLSRKSTSGGVIQIGSHTIKTWSSTQSTIALSSGEAEYYGLVKAASQSIGIRNIMRDLGFELHIQINTDASVAKSIAMRRGTGNVRHIEVNQLWVQERVAKGELEIRKVGTEENIADILTKHIDRETLEKHLSKLPFIRESGHHDIALKPSWEAS